VKQDGNMNDIPLTADEKNYLLTLARKAISSAVNGKRIQRLSRNEGSPRLWDPGAVFVTLTIGGELRGCIGSLEPRQPLIEDVIEHAVDAAQNDYRFYPVGPEEVPLLEIEISRLTLPEPLTYSSPEELPKKIRPHIDGLVLYDGGRRATFLPQVWDTLPKPEDFLDHLCTKMGAPADLWRHKVLGASVYQVEEFREGQTRIV
jgi:AmmeMemoRadiSam system protein A